MVDNGLLSNTAGKGLSDETSAWLSKSNVDLPWLGRWGGLPILISKLWEVEEPANECAKGLQLGGAASTEEDQGLPSKRLDELED